MLSELNCIFQELFLSLQKIWSSKKMDNRDKTLCVTHYDAVQIEQQNIFVFEEVVIYRVTKGCVVIQRDQHRYDLQEGDSFILAELSHIKIEACSEDSEITVCQLSKHFTDKIYLLIDFKMIEIIFGADGGGYISTSRENVDTNLTLDKLFALYNNSSHPLREQYIYSLIYCYLLELYQEAFQHRKSSVVGTSKYVSYSIDRFFMLCHEFHTTQHTTQFYADKLGLSSRYLYQIVKSVTNQTPKQVINGYLMESSRRLLLTTTHSTSHIAEILNFPDQSSFGQFFKRNAGVSPTEFRQHY